MYRPYPYSVYKDFLVSKPHWGAALPGVFTESSLIKLREREGQKTVRINNPLQLAVFTLEEHRYALELSIVERVLRAAEITPVPDVPDIVMGIINLQGRVIPVLNVRRRFRLPEREISIHDHLIIAKTTKRVVALLVDEVLGVAAYTTTDIVPPGEILPSFDFVEGVVKTADGIILIHDLDRFLSLDEESALNAATSTDKK